MTDTAGAIALSCYFDPNAADNDYKDKFIFEFEGFEHNSTNLADNYNVNIDMIAYVERMKGFKLLHLISISF